jgi:phosphatidylinositol kinase/protein kinase (PI-3  family)
VLRENQETLISVLEPFLRDPTVGWDRQGKAQQATAQQVRSSSDIFDPRDVLVTVRERLRGVYNLRNSHAWGTKSSSNKPQPPTGITDSSMEFSVQGQVQRLIEEATSDENLCQMYVGWMPWL